jgi:hypothetical protein
MRTSTIAAPSAQLAVLRHTSAKAGQLPQGMSSYGPQEVTLAWFEDLTPYAYLDETPTQPPTLNVGWLEDGHAFSTGDVPADFAERLAVLCEHGTMNRTRGLHFCDLCPPPPDDDYELDAYPSGSAEVRAVAEDGTRFAAPSLIFHYVTAHRYVPPQAFIEAVLRTKIEWDHAEANDLCISCGTALTRGRRLDGFVMAVTREPIFIVDFTCAPCGTQYSRSFPDPGAPTRLH